MLSKVSYIRILPPFSLVVFLQNSRKYGLRSLRKTSHGGHSTPQVQVPHADSWPYPYNQPTLTGKREMPGSISDRACRPSLPEFSLVFTEIRVHTS